MSLPKLHAGGHDLRLCFVHLTVKDDETERSAVAFLKEAVQAFPFHVTQVLTDRGSCFTADGFEAACRKLGVEHRKTRPYTPKTNSMVERFNGRIQREVLGITVASHRDVETLLHGFNRAYNAQRQGVLKGRSPEVGAQSPEPGYEEPQVVTGRGQNGIDRAAMSAQQTIALNQAVALQVPDHG